MNPPCKTDTIPFNRKRLERMATIEILLLHYGTINRKVLEELFGLSTPQISQDIQQFMLHAPDQMAYDKSLKTYKRLPTFRRIWS